MFSETREYCFTMHYHANAGLHKKQNFTFSDERLCLFASGLHPDLRCYNSGDWLIGLLGNPIANRFRNDQSVIDLFAEHENALSTFAGSLNGSFLIILYHRRNGHLTIISDRFSSLEFFYSVDEMEFRGSFSLLDLCDLRKKSGVELKLNKEAIFEFIAMRRLFGEHTLESNTNYLASATILTLHPGESSPDLKKYWSPDYSIKAPKGKQLVDLIAERLENTINMHISDDDDRLYGLFLSGGLDARAILSTMDDRTVCITTCLSQNNEFRVAAELTAIVGAKHEFVQRPMDLYNEQVDRAVRLSSGMHSFVECQFLDYHQRISCSVDTILMGLALDVFLTGLYLPKAPVRYFGRPALHYKLQSIGHDIVNDFIGNVSYRLKTVDPFSLLKQNSGPDMKDSLYSSLKNIESRGRTLGAKGYDLWEFFHLHNFSRHYSFPMMSSVRTWADCRSPGLENNLFDLAFSMTAQQKVNADAYIKALKKLNPEMMKIRNANTNLTAGMSLKTQTLIKSLRMLSHYLLGTNYPQSPGWKDRSWPLVGASMDASINIRKLIHELPESITFQELDFLEQSKIAHIVEEHETGTADHGTTLAILVTLDKAVKHILGKQ